MDSDTQSEKVRIRWCTEQGGECCPHQVWVIKGYTVCREFKSNNQSDQKALSFLLPPVPASVKNADGKNTSQKSLVGLQFKQLL